MDINNHLISLFKSNFSGIDFFTGDPNVDGQILKNPIAAQRRASELCEVVEQKVMEDMQDKGVRIEFISSSITNIQFPAGMEEMKK